MAASTGGLLLCTTVTTKLCVAPSGGRPLSVTTTLKALLPNGECAGDGMSVHLGGWRRTLVGFMVAFVATSGPRLKVNKSPSESEATFVMVSVIPTAMV